MSKGLLKITKKGFTLIELVVTIAILAILAAIAIPVVNSIMVTAATNAAISDAGTIEYSVKTAYAEYASKTTDTYHGISSSICPSLKDVVKANSLYNAVEPKNVDGSTYVPVWNSATEECMLLKANAAGAYTTTDIYGNAVTFPPSVLHQLSRVDASGNIIVEDYDIASWTAGYSGTAL